MSSPISRVLGRADDARTTGLPSYLRAFLAYFALHIDISGSTSRHHPEIVAGRAALLANCQQDPAFAEWWLNFSEMSGVVASSGYVPVAQVVPPSIKPGYRSPIHQWLDLFVSDNATALLRAPEPVLNGMVIVTDGKCSADEEFSETDLQTAIDRFRAHQAKHAVHVFVCAVGDEIDWDVINALSVHHKPVEAKLTEFSAILEQSMALIRALAKTPEDVTKYVSLKMDTVRG